MSEITDTAAVRTLTIKIGRAALGNLANARLYQLVDSNLGDTDPEPEPVEEAEFCLAITKAIAHKCGRIVVEIDAESITARGPMAGAGA